MKNKTIRTFSFLAALSISITACNTSNTNQNDSEFDSVSGDTALMDTTMSTGTGTDTIKQKLKEGEDGTGKASTDPRTRKQQ